MGHLWRRAPDLDKSWQSPCLYFEPSVPLFRWSSVPLLSMARFFPLTICFHQCVGSTPLTLQTVPWRFEVRMTRLAGRRRCSAVFVRTSHSEMENCRLLMEFCQTPTPKHQTFWTPLYSGNPLSQHLIPRPSSGDRLGGQPTREVNESRAP